MWIIAVMVLGWVFVWAARRIVARMRDTDALRAQVAELTHAWQTEYAWRVRLQTYIAGSERVVRTPAPVAPVAVPAEPSEPLSAEWWVDSEPDPLDAPQVVIRRRKPKRRNPSV
jgi:hypothetical protein